MAVSRPCSNAAALSSEDGYPQITGYLKILKIPEKIAEIVPDALSLQRIRLASLRCEHRELSSRRNSLCSDALTIIGVVETLCRSCTRRRKERIAREIKIRLREGIRSFDGARVDLFPNTIDFLREMGVRLDTLMDLLTRFIAECTALRADTKGAVKVAEEEEMSSKMWRCAITVASAGAAIGGYFTGHGATGLLLGSAIYSAGGGVRYQEEAFKQMKDQMESLNSKIHQLSVVMREIKNTIHYEGSKVEMQNVRRPQPSLHSVKLSINTIFQNLNEDINFTAQKEKVRALLQDDI